MRLVLKFTPQILDDKNRLLSNIEQKIFSTTTEFCSINSYHEAEYANVGMEEAVMLVRLLWSRPEFKGLKVIRDETRHSAIN